MLVVHTVCATTSNMQRDAVSLGALLWAGSPVPTSTGLHPGSEGFGVCPNHLLARARAITLGRL